MKPFLILQVRYNDGAADNELEAILKYSGLQEGEYKRIRLEKESLPENINLKEYSGVIVGGGPSNVSDPEEKKSDIQKRFESELYSLLDSIVAQDFPYLGACYGLGILASHQGAEVSQKQYSEPLSAPEITLQPAANGDKLLTGVEPKFLGFVGHKEAVQAVPKTATLLASSAACPVQLIKVKENIYATQFHPELDARGLEYRIHIYKDAGYFPPESAQEIIDQTKDIVVTEPGKILKNFVTLYKQN